MKADSLEARLGAALKARRFTLATAESCTGGLIGHRLTNVPGSSDYYLGGIVAYANAVKEKLLGVPPATLSVYGAVSRETAEEMARGARRALGADLAVSVTGIAGPDGGGPDKPVGLTWIGLSTPEGESARQFIWGRDREGNKADSAAAALEMVLEYLRP
jgi:PncC family amidohydrolase